MLPSSPRRMSPIRYQQENIMAVKFSETDYWNPAEWVSRTLFTQIAEDRIITNTEYEKELKNDIKNCIKTNVWLIDYTNSEPYKLEIFQELVNFAHQQIEVPIEYKEGYKTKSIELETKLNANIQKRNNHGEWNYIEGWKKGFGISIPDLEEWAYSQNGIFSDQDEDLIMWNPNLIMPMFKLLGSKWCRRNKDLKLTLLGYYRDHKRRGKDENVTTEFEKLFKMQIMNKVQENLLTEMKSS